MEYIDVGISDVPEFAFEGPEKFLEIDFKPIDPTLDLNIDRTMEPTINFKGFRNIEKAEWNEILVSAACTILDSRSNEFFDAYLLSESSLFVYPVKIILKTCGTTTLLKVLPVLIEIAKRFGVVVEWLAYSRKDFLYPQKQIYPHQSFRDEVQYLQRFYPEGEGFVMGPITGDHWFCFTAEPKLDRCLADSNDRNLDMMMFDIHPDVAKLFFKGEMSASEITNASGISTLMPGAIINDFVFDPCGYSLNALDKQTHYTIHITPQPFCSFVSFATNSKATDLVPLMMKVLSIFRPKKFTCSLFADVGVIEENKELENPFKSSSEQAKMEVDGKLYLLSSSTKTSFISEYSCLMANYVLIQNSTSPHKNTLSKNLNSLIKMERSSSSKEIYENS